MNGAKKSFPPVIATGARLLILGSLPGDESLAHVRYYAHKRNAFWPIMARILGFDAQLPYQQKLERLKRNGIALWDVLASGHREGSLDSNIKKPSPNDIEALVAAYPSIERIYCNGGASFRYLRKYMPSLFKSERLMIKQLPSTSPAAARMTFEQKLEVYTCHFNDLFGNRER